MLRARFCLFRARRTRTQFQTIKFQSKNYSHPSPLTFKAPSPFESTPETEQQKRAKLTTKTYHPDLSENSVQKYGRFWRKFLDDAALLHKVESGDEQAFQDLVESLAQVHPNLDLEINRGTKFFFLFVLSCSEINRLSFFFRNFFFVPSSSLVLVSLFFPFNLFLLSRSSCSFLSSSS